ncbi:MAG: hypothetical protein R6U00_01740, partial [Prochlorococcaceae cyanobacterium]
MIQLGTANEKTLDTMQLPVGRSCHAISSLFLMSNVSGDNMSTDNSDSIPAKLEGYRASLAVARDNGELAMARKLEQQITELLEFQGRHPEISEAPSA